MYTPYPIHVPLEQVVPERSKEAGEALPDGGRSISSLLLVGNGPIYAHQIAEPLIESQPLMY